jgi:hypothetical protein
MKQVTKAAMLQILRNIRAECVVELSKAPTDEKLQALSMENQSLIETVSKADEDTLFSLEDE